ncbi:MAG: pyruvate formate lyase-activating protein [Clostridia bacterium]|nr:pyruvate formate lyase-activating protein [Clostridia bacterium]
MMGRIHSIQSLGALDGPGIRFTVFLQGCDLRCKCCHNPDTWNMNEGTEISAEEIVKKAVRYKEYFGEKGGITLSGGEPLLQPEFVKEIFTLAKAEGINTCLDTSGAPLTQKVRDALSVTDRVLLDIKYTNDEQYLENVGCRMDRPLDFLYYLNENGIPVTLRQVIIPTLNDTEENIALLSEISHNYACVDGTELLPFKKICQVKYDNLGIEFPLAHLPEPTKQQMQLLETQLMNN